MEWVTRKNIERFETLLASDQNPAKIAMLRSLLQAEQEKLAKLLSQAPT